MCGVCVCVCCVSGCMCVCGSLVPRPSMPPVFDRLQYTASDQKLEVWKAWKRGYVLYVVGVTVGGCNS